MIKGMILCGLMALFYTASRIAKAYSWVPAEAGSGGLIPAPTCVCV